MDMFARLDPELVEPLSGVLEAMGGGLDLNDIAGMRAMLQGMTAAIKEEAPPVEGVESEDRSAPGTNGAADVDLRIYRPAGATGNLPGLLWMHGGGFALGDIELDDLMAAQMAKDVGCTVVSVDYRLAPEDPYPAAIDDCYSALEYIAGNASDLGIREERIAVGGASAGGGLAAGLALLSRDRGQIPIAFQLLIYPAINDCNTAPADEDNPDTLFWNRANNILAWNYYLNGKAGDADVPAYAAPFRAENLSGLPPAYIPVGELDLFVEDNSRYAQRLIAASVPTELHIYPGAFHAFDVFAPMSSVSQRFLEDRNTILRRALFE